MTRLFVSFYLFMAVSLVLISSTLELIWPGEDYRESADMMLSKFFTVATGPPSGMHRDLS